VGIVRERGTGLDLPLYLKGYDRLKHQQSNQINISFVPLLFSIAVDSNIAFFTSIFSSSTLLRLQVSCVVYRSQDKP
jgi:hypothetical protein